MPKVSISSGLQKYFANNSELSIDAKTVFELLSAMEKSFPDSKGKVISEKGTLNRFVKIFVDGKDIDELEALETKLNPKSKVKILMALAGG